MRTSKLLELAALLAQYAEGAAGARQLVARSLGKLVGEEAMEQEKESQKGNPCD